METFLEFHPVQAPVEEVESSKAYGKHLFGEHYRFRIKTYLFYAAGVATSYQLVTHDGVLSDGGLSWSSTGISETFNLDGTQINAGCSTIVASRVVLD